MGNNTYGNVILRWWRSVSLSSRSFTPNWWNIQQIVPWPGSSDDHKGKTPNVGTAASRLLGGCVPGPPRSRSAPPSNTSSWPGRAADLCLCYKLLPCLMSISVVTRIIFRIIVWIYFLSFYFIHYFVRKWLLYIFNFMILILHLFVIFILTGQGRTSLFDQKI